MLFRQQFLPKKVLFVSLRQYSVKNLICSVTLQPIFFPSKKSEYHSCKDIISSCSEGNDKITFCKRFTICLILSAVSVLLISTNVSKVVFEGQFLLDDNPTHQLIRTVGGYCLGPSGQQTSTNLQGLMTATNLVRFQDKLIKCIQQKLM